MPNQPRLKVIKVPLDYEPVFKPNNFAPMPRLYMEYLENKIKVKPELRNKEYIPKLVNYSYYQTPNEQQVYQNTVESRPSSPKRESRDINQLENNVNNKVDSRIDSRPTSQNTSRTDELSKQKKLQILDISKMSDKEIEELQKKKVEKRENNLYRYKRNIDRKENVDVRYEDKEEKSYNRDNKDNKENKDNEDNEDNDDIGYIDYKSNRDEIKDDSKPVDTFKNDSNPIEATKSVDKKVDKDEENLLNLLKGQTKEYNQSPPQTSSVPQYSQSASYSSIPSSTINSSTVPSASVPNLPPSISEINSGKVFSSPIRDLSSSVVSDEELSRKRKILSDFKRIKKMDKDANIPEFSELTDLATLEREYSNVVRNLHVDSNVENYKKWLTMGFVGLEFFLTSIMKFDDIKGFSAAQMTNMNQYEKILVEIGEKSYVPEEKRLAPELRLIGIIMMNAAIFVGTKMLFKSTGNSMLNMMNTASTPPTANGMNDSANLGGMFGNFAGGFNNNTSSKPKKKMPGPNIDLNDLNFKKND